MDKFKHTEQHLMGQWDKKLGESPQQERRQQWKSEILTNVTEAGSEGITTQALYTKICSLTNTCFGCSFTLIENNIS